MPEANVESTITTVTQLAQKYQLHPAQFTQCKATIRDHSPELFEAGQADSLDHHHSQPLSLRSNLVVIHYNRLMMEKP